MFCLSARSACFNYVNILSKDANGDKYCYIMKTPYLMETLMSYPSPKMLKKKREENQGVYKDLALAATPLSSLYLSE